MPQGFHDWNKFINPEVMVDTMKKVGFTDIVIKGLALTGGTSFTTLKNILFKGLTDCQESKAKLLNVQINDDISVWYIGKVVKIV